MFLLAEMFSHPLRRAPLPYVGERRKNYFAKPYFAFASVFSAVAGAMKLQARRTFFL
jgi:hypothetical protein